MEEAGLLLDNTLDLKLEVLEHRLRADIAAVRVEIAGLAARLHADMREQTWRLTGAMIASMAIIATILRFA
ncbi:MAG: hypothetical protein WD598_00875 [Acidimicrobiia bacterium]